MSNNSAAIDNFIKKYRLALSNKSKDIRITIEEAGDLVAFIALINANQETLANMEKKLDSLHQKFNTRQVEPTPGIDGGGFKS